MSWFGTLFSSATITYTPDGTLTLHSAPGRYLVWALAFLLVMPIARYCWRRGIGGHYAPGAFIASFIIPLLIVPGIAMESVRVTPAAIEVRTGFWFAPTRFRYELTGVSEVEEKQIRVPQRRIPRRDRVWVLHYDTGRTVRLHLTDLLDANRTTVADYLRGHGIKYSVVFMSA